MNRRIASRYVADLGCDVRLVVTPSGIELRARTLPTRVFPDRVTAFAAYDAMCASQHDRPAGHIG